MTLADDPRNNLGMVGTWTVQKQVEHADNLLPM